jgi:hypothetical protein
MRYVVSYKHPLWRDEAERMMRTNPRLLEHIVEHAPKLEDGSFLITTYDAPEWDIDSPDEALNAVKAALKNVEGGLEDCTDFEVMTYEEYEKLKAI